MKNLLTLLCILSFSLNLSAQNSGGPDTYGYTWKNSNYTTNPPSYNWVDITTRGTQVTGLSDDNIIGPFGLSTPFHFYWYNITKFWVGSNGYVSFSGYNMASPFPAAIPTAGGGDNWVAPLLSDLIFTGTGNPAKCYTYVNADSIVVSYIDVPFWIVASPGYTGSNSFQVILSRRDSSITFNYLKTDMGTLTTIDDAVGIENNTGAIGLQNYTDALPPDTFSIKYYYPWNTTYQVTDVGINWNNNSKNGGIFTKFKKPVTLTSNAKNFGNQNVGSFSIRDTVYNSSGTNLLNGSKTIQSLAVNVDSTVTFSSAFTPATAGIYKFNTGLSGVTNDMVTSNNYLSQEIVAIDTSQITMTLEYSDGTSEGGLGWNGGGGGVGVYIEPPFYPAQIVSSRFYIRSNATPAVGFSAQIYDDDGPNGSRGTLLDSVNVAASTITTGAYKTVNPSKPIYINSGGIYLFWNMGGAGINIGKDLTPPFSRRTYEILFGAWADYRDVLTEDFLMGINVEYTFPTADFQTVTTGDPTILFTDKSTKNPTWWRWDFGDSSAIDTTQNPSHTYLANRTYNVCLTAGNSAGYTKTCKNQVISKVPPVADFTIDTLQDPKINFADKSTNNPTSWSWKFGEKSAGSTLKNPSYTYTLNGTHTVCLVATNAGGSDTVCKTVNIKKATPLVGFIIDATLDPYVTFTDTSLNNPNKWEWDFGDLSPKDTNQHTVHTYTKNGTFAVCLKITSPYGTSFFCKYVTIIKVPPVANFTFNNLLDPKITFTDNSTNTPSSWLWDFDENGATANIKSPTHTFTRPGKHNVCLISTNAGGSDTICKIVNICKLTPVAKFSADTAADPFVSFTDSTIGCVSSRIWTFDDLGATDTARNPMYTFKTNGNHNVCLKVTNSIGSNTYCKNIFINKVPPKAEFNFSTLNDPEIAFTDVTANIPTSWLWDFDDNMATSTSQHPKHVFSKNGDFNVCLIASNAGGSDTICKKVSIAKNLPDADFSYDVSADPAVNFSDLSTNTPLSWLWNFDEDNTTSTAQNPSHTYKNNGNYNVCLKVTNAGGSDSVCKTVTINKIIPTANFSYDTTQMPTISFSDISVNNPTMWKWDFDDSGNDSSDLQNPSYTFKKNGMHKVCLVTGNAGGKSNPLCKDIFITGVIGINDAEQQMQIMIYPNPFDESTIIEIQSPSLYTGLILRCRNTLGQVVQADYSVNGNKINLKKGNLSEGYYFIEVFNLKEKIAQGRVLVK